MYDHIKQSVFKIHVVMLIIESVVTLYLSILLKKAIRYVRGDRPILNIEKLCFY